MGTKKAKSDAREQLPAIMRHIIEVANEGGKAWLKKLRTSDPAKFATILIQLSRLSDKYLESPSEAAEQRFGEISDEALLSDLFEYLKAQFAEKGYDLVLRQKAS